MRRIGAASIDRAEAASIVKAGLRWKRQNASNAYCRHIENSISMPNDAKINGYYTSYEDDDKLI